MPGCLELNVKHCIKYVLIVTGSQFKAFEWFYICVSVCMFSSFIPDFSAILVSLQCTWSVVSLVLCPSLSLRLIPLHVYLAVDIEPENRIKNNANDFPMHRFYGCHLPSEIGCTATTRFHFQNSYANQTHTTHLSHAQYFIQRTNGISATKILLDKKFIANSKIKYI